MNNISVAIDAKRNVFRALYQKNKDIRYAEIPFDPEYANGGVDHEKIFSYAFAQLSAKDDILPASLVFVLPDEYVAGEYIEIPSSAAKRFNDTLQLEISTRYKDEASKLKTVFVQLCEQSNYVGYMAYMIRNDLISSVHSALRSVKLSARSVTFESAALANAYMTIKGMRRREPVLFVDIRNDVSKLTILHDNDLVGFSEIPWGQNVLTLDRRLIDSPPVLPTEELYRSDISTICRSEEGSGNEIYLVRTLSEMCDVAAEKYHLSNIVTRFNAPAACGELLLRHAKEFRGMESLELKNAVIAENLDLYGGLVPRLYNKGLFF